MMRILSKTSLCSSLAIATAMLVGARPAAAQVAGNLDNAGSATITGGGSSVVLNNPQTTIDWTATGAPTAGVRNFLPSGNTMAFSGSSDFAVLNRVSSGSDMIGLNGTITSSVDGVSGRGSVFFYNPNGIVVGGSAIIDVGSLGLTTSPVNGAGTSNWFSGFNGAAPTLTFNQAAAGSQIRIDPGASIKSNGTNSFIAMVAPKITTAGNIKTDGDVALVAAEAATLYFDDQYDLYSIQVDIGTSVSDSLNVTGGSIARNSGVETSGVGRNAYLIAVPKNDATTLLISGGASLGFDVANSAIVEGNSIILSAGRDTSIFSTPQGDGTIDIRAATFTSDVTGSGTKAVSIAPTGGETLFTGTADFQSEGSISLNAAGGDILIGGDLFADVDAFAFILGLQDVTAGTISLAASGGHTLSVGGETSLTADAHGADTDGQGSDGFFGQAGTVTLLADNGSISLNDLTVSANGFGGRTDAGTTGGAGYGGEIRLTSANGGDISTGTATLYAKGLGGSSIECSDCDLTGGYGQGGTITLEGTTGSGNSLSFDTLDAQAFGEGGGGDFGGMGEGGTVDVILNGGTSISIGSLALLFADGLGGYGSQTGGAGQGGTARIRTIGANGGSVTANGSIYLTADAAGGDSYDGVGGSGTGGSTSINAPGAAILATNLEAHSNGFGGASFNGLGGDGHGGTTFVTVSAGGSLTTRGSLQIGADGREPIGNDGVDPAQGGTSTGGTATLLVNNGSVATNTTGVSQLASSLTVSARGVGATGTDGNGGDAQGGTANLVVGNGGSVAAQNGASISVDASAIGGTGTALGGDALGGLAWTTIASGANVTAATYTVDGSATGGAGDAGGGSATGQAVNVVVNGGSLTLSQILMLKGTAKGGAGLSGDAAGGDAVGADTSLLATASTLALGGRIELNSEATGGAAVGNANGGAGTGGDSLMTIGGGSTIGANNLYLMSIGYGGAANCIDCSGRGGNGIGGTATMIFNAGAASSVTVNNTLQILGMAYGGTGTGDAGGGDGQGADATLQLSSNATLTSKAALIFADGLGGAAHGFGNAGSGSAATAKLTGSGTIVHNGVNSPFHVTAEGFGGASEYGDAGSATGGTALIEVTSLTFTSASQGLYASAYALAGNSLGGIGGSADAGDVLISLNNSTVNLGGLLETKSFATAGSGAVGGNALAGKADIVINGGSLISGSTLANNVSSIIMWGAALGGAGSDGNGGSATAAQTALGFSNGAMVSAKSITIDTYAVGGNAAGSGASAGNADGGIGLLVNSGATANIAGNVTINAYSTGGVGSGGADGGNAGLMQVATIRATNGAINIGGNLLLDARTRGGDGRNGGNALAAVDIAHPENAVPFAGIVATGGSVTVAGASTLDASAIGGNGSDGGKGGNAAGGFADIIAFNNPSNPSIISLGAVTMNAGATGGNGGSGADGATGADGGDGGNALAGYINVLAGNLNGRITTGDLDLSIATLGGSGGSGGMGTDGAGGNGGNGGWATGNAQTGLVQIGTYNDVVVSAPPTAFAHLGNISIDAGGVGGDGGSAGYSTIGSDGQAGNGGDAGGNFVAFVSRGAEVTAGDVTITSNAVGGSGGYLPSEARGGTGGSAQASGLLVSSASRAGAPAQRGAILAGDVSFSSAASGGAGAVDGTSQIGSAIVFEVNGGDINATSLTAAMIADGVSASVPGISAIRVTDGVLTVANALSLETAGDLAVWVQANPADPAGSATVSAGSLTLAARDFVHRPSSLAPSPFGLISAATMDVSSGGDIIIDADLDAGGNIDFVANGSIGIGSAVSDGGSIVLTANGGFVLSNDLMADSDVLITALGNVDTKSISSGGDIGIDGAAISVDGNLLADGTVTINAAGALDVGNVTAGNSINLASVGDLSAGVLDAGWAISLFAGGDVSFASASTENDDIEVTSGGAVTSAGNLTSGQDIEIDAVGLVSTGNLRAQGAITVEAGAIDVGDVSAGIDLGLCGGICSLDFPEKDIGLWSMTTINAGNLSSTGRIGMAAGDDISVGTIDAVDLVMILAGGDFSAGHIVTDGEVFIGGFDMFSLGYDAETGDFDAAPVLAQFPTATGGNILVSGDIAGSRLRANAGGSFTSGDVAASGAEASIYANGAIGVGSVDAATDITLNSAAAGVQGHDLTAGGSLSVYGAGALSMWSAAANGGYLDLISDAGISVTTGGLDALYGLYINAGGAVSVAGDAAASYINIYGDGNILLHDLTADNDIGIVGGGTLTLGDATAGIDVYLAAPGGITGGDISGTYFALAMSNGPVQLTSLNASSEGYAGIGGMDAYDAGNVDGFLSYYAWDAIQSVGPAGATNVGAINAGAVSTHTASLTLGTLNAGFAQLVATGLVSATGAWTTSDLGITSRDIQIGANASINTDFVEFESTNTIGAALGSNTGAANGSYVLDNAEFQRIDANEIQFEARVNNSPIDLLIGDLTLHGSENSFEFGAVDATGGETAGRVRVVGKIVGQNFTDDDSLELEGQLVEVDAVTGGIDFSPNSDTPVGTLWISGQRFHVAEASILDKLAENPDYAGRDTDLALAPTAPHAETTINVGTVNLELFVPGQGGFAAGPQAVAPYSIYVQNMANPGGRSGLLIRDAELFGDLSEGSVSMIISGKWVTPDGTLSGAAVRDAFVEDPENNLAVFSAESSINGCGLTDGAGCFTPAPPPPPPPPQVEDLANQFVFLDTSTGDMLGFGDEDGSDGGDESEDEGQKAKETNAIDPPPTVINGKPIDPQTPTDEAVSGSGNPALIGTGSNQQEQQ